MNGHGSRFVCLFFKLLNAMCEVLLVFQFLGCSYRRVWCIRRTTRDVMQRVRSEAAGKTCTEEVKDTASGCEHPKTNSEGKHGYTASAFLIRLVNTVY